MYNSTYTDIGGQRYDTRYNRRYNLNLVAGRELKLNPAGTKILSFNGKVLNSGGMRQMSIDLAASRAEGTQVYVPKQNFTEQAKAYLRFDMSVAYKRNYQHSTHTLSLEVQNVTNRQNVYGRFYDRTKGTIHTEYQLGILPNISYRIEF